MRAPRGEKGEARAAQVGATWGGKGWGPDRAQAALSRGLRPRAGPARLSICEPCEAALERPPFHSTRSGFGPRTWSGAGQGWRVKGLLEQEMSLRLKASKDPRLSWCPGGLSWTCGPAARTPFPRGPKRADTTKGKGASCWAGPGPRGRKAGAPGTCWGASGLLWKRPPILLGRRGGRRGGSLLPGVGGGHRSPHQPEKPGGPAGFPSPSVCCEPRPLQGEDGADGGCHGDDPAPQGQGAEGSVTACSLAPPRR